VKKWTRWAYAAAAALVLVVGCTVALNIDQPDSVSLVQPKALVLGAGDALIASDGTDELAVAAARPDENYSAWKKFEVEELDSARGTLEALAAEYSGSCTVEEKNDGQTMLCIIELPREYMEDFFSAASRVGAEMNSETRDTASDTAVIYIQLDKKA